MYIVYRIGIGIIYKIYYIKIYSQIYPLRHSTLYMQNKFLLSSSLLGIKYYIHKK